MNEHRTCTGSDTRLTQRCSPPVAAPRHLHQVTRQALALGLSVERIDVGLAALFEVLTEPEPAAEAAE